MCVIDMTDISSDGTPASGRRPKGGKALHGNLFDLGLAQKLEEKIEGLEAQIAGLCKVEKELRQSEEGYRCFLRP